MTKDFLWDPACSPQRLLAATSAGGTDRVVYGNGPLYLLRGPAQDPVALVTDGQGSIRAEVNAAQQVSGAWRYALYGAVAQSRSGGPATPALLAYTGQLLDATGLYFLRARWYDPASARLLSRDPLSRGPSLTSAFGYGAANPLVFGDPSGFVAETLGAADPGIRGLGTCETCVPIVVPPPVPVIDLGPVIRVIADVIIAAAATVGIWQATEKPASPHVEPGEVAGKTPAEIDDIARRKGLIPMGPDPTSGRGSYIDPETGEQRILIHSRPQDGSAPHIHVNDPQGERLDISGRPVRKGAPGAHLPIGFP